MQENRPPDQEHGQCEGSGRAALQLFQEPEGLRTAGSAYGFFRQEIPANLWPLLIDPAAEIPAQMNTGDAGRYAAGHPGNGGGN
jgi:hypothetical protein